MKAAEITDGLIEQLQSGKIGHARLNFANGDMVGSIGSINAPFKLKYWIFGDLWNRVGAEDPPRGGPRKPDRRRLPGL